MRAVRLYGIGDLRVENADIPKVSDDSVLLEVFACGVCGSDIPRVNHYGAHILPLTIGHEFSGKIVEMGKNVTSFAIGDNVTVPPLMPCEKCTWCKMGEYSLCEDYTYFGSRRDGGMAEYVDVPQKNLLKLPVGMDPADGATLDPCANAMHGLVRAGMREGASVCIYGVGAIGLFAVKLAKILGASKVVAVDLGERKLGIAKDCGADVVINAATCDAPAAVLKALPEGANIVLDITGSPIAQANCIASASKLGKIALVGISHQQLTLTKENVDDIMRKQLTVVGSWNSFGGPFPGFDWAESLKLFGQGLLNAEGVITHRCALEEAPDMFKCFEDKTFFFNKVMFFPSL